MYICYICYLSFILTGFYFGQEIKHTLFKSQKQTINDQTKYSVKDRILWLTGYMSVWTTIPVPTQLPRKSFLNKSRFLITYKYTDYQV